MRTLLISILVTLSIVFTAFPVTGGAAESKKPSFKYTDQEILDFFSQYSPQDIVKYAKLAVELVKASASSVTNQPLHEEQKFFIEKLSLFYASPSIFPYSDTPKHPFLVIARCDESRVLVHPVQSFFPTIGKKGFLRKYKDVRGKKTIYQLCHQIGNQQNGVWETQYQWWPDTNKPLPMGVLMLKIPKTPYHVQAFYPTQQYTAKQLNNLSQ